MPVVSQVRYRKRIHALSRLGVQPTTLAFERPYFPGEPEGGYISLGWLEHGSYAQRFLPFAKALPQIRAQAREADVIYAFGLDMLMLAWLATRGLTRHVKLMYEVGDIRDALLGKGVRARALRSIETFLVRQIDRLIVTSRAYMEHYYQGMLGLSKVPIQVIENKLEEDSGLPALQVAAPDDKIIRIGYFGLLRCLRSWNILRELSEQANGRVRVYMRGYPMVFENLAELVKDYQYIEYGGTYIAPQELPDLYSQVDLVWASGPYGNAQPVGNWRWARANRFYEACYFKKPMLCQQGTEDGRVVEEFDLGLTLDLGDIEGTVQRLRDISFAELAHWTANQQALPCEVYTYTDEHRKLYEALLS